MIEKLLEQIDLTLNDNLESQYRYLGWASISMSYLSKGEKSGDAEKLYSNEEKIRLLETYISLRIKPTSFAKHDNLNMGIERGKVVFSTFFFSYLEKKIKKYIWNFEKNARIAMSKEKDMIIHKKFQVAGHWNNFQEIKLMESGEGLKFKKYVQLAKILSTHKVVEFGLLTVKGTCELFIFNCFYIWNYLTENNLVQLIEDNKVEKFTNKFFFLFWCSEIYNELLEWRRQKGNLDPNFISYYPEYYYNPEVLYKSRFFEFSTFNDLFEDRYIKHLKENFMNFKIGSKLSFFYDCLYSEKEKMMNTQLDLDNMEKPIKQTIKYKIYSSHKLRTKNYQNHINELTCGINLLYKNI